MNEHEKINYVEFPAKNIKATKGFFTAVFGWSFVDYGPEYTALAATISSNLRLSEAPGNVYLKRRESRLNKDSVINVSQLLTLDKKYISEKIGRLSPKRMLELEEGLRIVLSL